MAAERRVEPAFREENVARLLDVPQHLETGLHILLRSLGTERMMQVTPALEDPGFAPPIAHVAERAEPFLALGWIGRERRHDELEVPAAIGIFDTRELRFEDV